MEQPGRNGSRTFGLQQTPLEATGWHQWAGKVDLRSFKSLNAQSFLPIVS
jgi:hypothetical protein